jgi:hypothetical protein
MKSAFPAWPRRSAACALVLLVVVALPQPSAAVQIYSRISTVFDPALDLTPAQQNDLTSAVAAHMASRIAIAENWKCVLPPSVKPPDTKQEAVFSQTDNQLFELITMGVKVTASGVSATIWRKTNVGRETSLASYGLPLNLSSLGHGADLEGKLADLLALAVDAAMSQAHPCGRWTGKIEYRAERTDEFHNDLSDSSHHRLLDITIKLTNQRVATATTHLEERGTSEGRIRAFMDGAVTIVRNSWQTYTTNGDGVTRATVGVSTVPQTKTYTVSVSFLPITAHKHVEGGARGEPPSSPSDVDFAVPWDGSTNIGGSLDDPKHLHGRISLIGRKTETMTETQTEEWDLQWEQ